MTERRPATEAGRRLAERFGWTSGETLGPIADVLAIEAQAADARVAALAEAIGDHVPSGGEGMDGYGYVECSCGWLSTSKVSWPDHILRAACLSETPATDARVAALMDALRAEPDVERLARALMDAANNSDRPITVTAYTTAIRVLEALAASSHD